jgi:hypothetical protein
LLECSLDGPLKSCFVVDLKYTKETRCPNVSERVLSVFNLPL